jgi:hypothetical protein
VGTTGDVAPAVLLRPAAVTHSNDMNQRHVELALSPKPGGISVKAPPSARVAPLGYYLLFVINGSGVPSIARWVKITR